MLPTILSVILIFSLLISILVMIRKRKQAGITGMKTALTSICFYLIAITNLMAYWFHFLGLVSWTITIILLILGAYFTRYLPTPEEVT